jgi:hypothetical protein
VAVQVVPAPAKHWEAACGQCMCWEAALPSIPSFNLMSLLSRLELDMRRCHVKAKASC